MSKIIDTPLMKQYREMKVKHPDAILLFRIGDSYEAFSEDAVLISNILGITLMRRANSTSSYIELAGFSHHALDIYLPKLVRAGRRVALCEQLEDPKLQKSKTARTDVLELIKPYSKSKPSPNLSTIKAFILILSAFGDVVNKLYIFDKIRLKTQEILNLATSLGISPRKAFEECYEIKQPSLFE